MVTLLRVIREELQMSLRRLFTAMRSKSCLGLFESHCMPHPQVSAITDLCQ